MPKLTTKCFGIFLPSKMKASDAVNYIIWWQLIKLLIIIPFEVLTVRERNILFQSQKRREEVSSWQKILQCNWWVCFREVFREKSDFFSFTTVALAAICLRCIYVARHPTTSENSGGRGKRKGSRGKRRGATKTRAFVAVDAFFNTVDAFYKLEKLSNTFGVQVIK